MLTWRALAAVGVLGTLVTSGLGAQTASGDERCDRWQLDGYRVGMPKNEAARVRPMKARKGWYEAREKGRYKGRLHFDGQDRLTSWSVTFNAPGFVQRGAEFIERFGEPSRENRSPVDVYRPPTLKPKVGSYSLEAEWKDEACRSLIRLWSLVKVTIPPKALGEERLTTALLYDTSPDDAGP